MNEVKVAQSLGGTEQELSLARRNITFYLTENPDPISPTSLVRILEDRCSSPSMSMHMLAITSMHANGTLVFDDKWKISLAPSWCIVS